jgi:hypothetical protein
MDHISKGQTVVYWIEFTQDSFHSFTVHLDVITPLFIQMNAQLDCSRNFKTYIKMLLHVSV